MLNVHKTFIVTMEYLSINGADVREFFDLNDTAGRIRYQQMINVPTFKTILKEIRGKALPDIKCYITLFSKSHIKIDQEQYYKVK